MAKYISNNPQARELIESCAMKEFNEGLSQQDVLDLVASVSEHYELDAADCELYAKECRAVFSADQPDLGREEPVQPEHSSLANEIPEPHWMVGYVHPRRKSVVKKYEAGLKYFKHRKDVGRLYQMFKSRIQDARDLIEFVADGNVADAGTHPHLLQGTEVIKNKSGAFDFLNEQCLYSLPTLMANGWDIGISPLPDRFGETVSRRKNPKKHTAVVKEWVEIIAKL